MLKYRLLFGALMTVLLTGLVVLDGLVAFPAPDGTPVRGTVLMLVVAAVVGWSGMELSRLATARGLVVLNPSSIIGLMLLATAWYWPQLIPVSRGTYLLLVAALALAGILIQQRRRFGADGVLANCGVSCFALLYLGGLAAFVLGIRLERGIWPTLMFFFVVKFSDIGAYTFGRLFGRHKFAPRISPGKTWEGMAGAAAVGVLISLAFAGFFDIMEWWPAVIFGVGMAFVGQLSDLTESMLKRDAGQKDSSNRVPGFGGILDVIDSPLFAAPLAYVFLAVAMR